MEEILLKINRLSKELGPISALAFKKDKLEDILSELEYLHSICIKQTD